MLRPLDSEAKSEDWGPLSRSSLLGSGGKGSSFLTTPRSTPLALQGAPHTVLLPVPLLGGQSPARKKRKLYVVD